MASKKEQTELVSRFRSELPAHSGPLSTSLESLLEQLGGPIEDPAVAFALGEVLLDYAEDGVGMTSRAEYQAFAAAFRQLMPEHRKCGKLVSRASRLVTLSRAERAPRTRPTPKPKPRASDFPALLSALGPPHDGHVLSLAAAPSADSNPLLSALTLWGGVCTFDAEGDFQIEGHHAELTVELVRHAGLRISAKDWRVGNTLFLEIAGVGRFDIETERRSDYVVSPLVEHAVLETLAKLAPDWFLYELPSDDQLVRLLILSRQAEKAAQDHPAWPELGAVRVQRAAEVGFASSQ